MKCSRKAFVPVARPQTEEAPPELPDTLTDCLTGETIPFTNRDYIRQAILGFLCNERGYRKEDFLCDQAIAYELEGEPFISTVDLVVVLDNVYLAAAKCSSGSLVTRRRQVVASARLIKEYVVPFSVVTNGRDIELLDSWTEEVITAGFESFPSRNQLREKAETLSLRNPPGKKLLYEYRILHTYDAIACPVKGA